MTNENDQVCQCGQHKGIGRLSPGDRAARYKRMLEKIPNYLDADQRAYLKTWEQRHGEVEYEMVQVGINSGAYNQAEKDKPLYGPRMFGTRPFIPQGRSKRGFSFD